MSTTPDARPAGDDAKAVKRGGRIVAAVIAGSLLLYWLADRYTPYTSQARVDGYVIGIAPKVAGEVVKVSVINNQTVKAGQPLFQIDPSQYRIGLDKARFPRVPAFARKVLAETLAGMTFDPNVFARDERLRRVKGLLAYPDATVAERARSFVADADAWKRRAGRTD